VATMPGHTTVEFIIQKSKIENYPIKLLFAIGYNKKNDDIQYAVILILFQKSLLEKL